MADQIKVLGPDSDLIGVADYTNHRFMLMENDESAWSNQETIWTFKPSTDAQFNDLNPSSSFRTISNFQLRRFNSGIYYAPYLCIVAKEGFAAVVPSFLGVFNPILKIPTYWAQNITTSSNLTGIDLLSSGKIAVSNNEWIRAYSPGLRNSEYVQTNVSGGIHSIYSDINNDVLWVAAGRDLKKYSVNADGTMSLVFTNTMLDPFTFQPIHGVITDVYPVSGREYLGDVWAVTTNSTDVIDGGNNIYIVNTSANIVNKWDYPMLAKIDEPGVYAVTNSMNSGSVLKAKGGDSAHLIGPDATLTWPGGNFGMMRWWREPSELALPETNRWDRQTFPSGI